MGRRHADKVRAGKEDGDWGPKTKAAISSVSPGYNGTGKSLVQLQAERIADSRLADVMSAAGVPVNRIGLELLYFLPRDFLDAYAEVFHEALDGDDGGMGARGRAGERTRELGRAHRKTTGGTGKKFKKYWTVRNEEALELKTRTDKRLRAIGRELRGFLDDQLAERNGEGNGETVRESKLGTGTGRPGTSGRVTCSGCGHFVSVEWRFCSSCGSSLSVHDG